MILQKDIAEYVLSHNLINGRIISVRIGGYPVNINVVQVYASITSVVVAEIEKFYGKFQEVLNHSIKSTRRVFGMQDWRPKNLELLQIACQ